LGDWRRVRFRFAQVKRCLRFPGGVVLPDPEGFPKPGRLTAATPDSKISLRLRSADELRSDANSTTPSELTMNSLARRLLLSMFGTLTWLQQLVGEGRAGAFVRHVCWSQICYGQGRRGPVAIGCVRPPSSQRSVLFPSLTNPVLEKVS